MKKVVNLQARIRDVSVIYDCFKILEKLVTLCRDTRIIGATKSGFLESIQNLNLVPWWNISGGIENNRFQIFKHLWGIYQKNVNIFELQQWLHLEYGASSYTVSLFKLYYLPLGNNWDYSHRPCWYYLHKLVVRNCRSTLNSIYNTSKDSSFIMIVCLRGLWLSLVLS